MVGGSPIKFVNQFKYLGHIVIDSLSDDDFERSEKFVCSYHTTQEIPQVLCLSENYFI